MLIESTPVITSISYSEITKELVICYNNNKIEKYVNVPSIIYENIVNNGRVLSEYLKEDLNNSYKKITLV